MADGNRVSRGVETDQTSESDYSNRSHPHPENETEICGQRSDFVMNNGFSGQIGGQLPRNGAIRDNLLQNRNALVNENPRHMHHILGNENWVTSGNNGRGMRSMPIYIQPSDQNPSQHYPDNYNQYPSGAYSHYTSEQSSNGRWALQSRYLALPNYGNSSNVGRRLSQGHGGQPQVDNFTDPPPYDSDSMNNYHNRSTLTTPGSINQSLPETTGNRGNFPETVLNRNWSDFRICNMEQMSDVSGQTLQNGDTNSGGSRQSQDIFDYVRSLEARIVNLEKHRSEKLFTNCGTQTEEYEYTSMPNSNDDYGIPNPSEIEVQVDSSNISTENKLSKPFDEYIDEPEIGNKYNNGETQLKVRLRDRETHSNGNNIPDVMEEGGTRTKTPETGLTNQSRPVEIQQTVSQGQVELVSDVQVLSGVEGASQVQNDGNNNAENIDSLGDRTLVPGQSTVGVASSSQRTVTGISDQNESKLISNPIAGMKIPDQQETPVIAGQNETAQRAVLVVQGQSTSDRQDQIINDQSIKQDVLLLKNKTSDHEKIIDDLKQKVMQLMQQPESREGASQEQQQEQQQQQQQEQQQAPANLEQLPTLSGRNCSFTIIVNK